MTTTTILRTRTITVKTAVFFRGSAPAALRACPHGLGRGSASSASPPQPWADGLRPCLGIGQQDPPTATHQAPAPSRSDGAPALGGCRVLSLAALLGLLLVGHAGEEPAEYPPP